MTKSELLRGGSVLVERFCTWNGLEIPALRAYSSAEWRFASACAYYRPVGIHICLERCAAPGTAGASWSWPGYVIDRTPHGVMAHELGHHVDWALSGVKGVYGGDFSVQMRARSGEPKLTNYCPNDWEWFAEMFRLFCTNPSLLEAVRPKTHQLMRDAGLRPVETRPWWMVLEGAPGRTLEQAAKRIAAVPRQGELL